MYKLTEEGKRVLENGLPEMKLMFILDKFRDKVTIEELQKLWVDEKLHKEYLKSLK